MGFHYRAARAVFRCPLRDRQAAAAAADGNEIKVRHNESSRVRR